MGKSSGGADSTAARKLAERLFSDPVEQTAFLAALSRKHREAVAVLWRTSPVPADDDGFVSPVWLPPCVQLVHPDRRPGSWPEHVAGKCYVLDPSSVFCGSVIQGSVAQTVLDLCAAPGGKSLLASTLLRPELLVANEVIGKRVPLIGQNFRRCGVGEGLITRADPSALVETVPEAFDVVIVDAPCSGQSLLAKGAKNPGCFHRQTVEHNAMRQRRVLAAGAGCVRPGGSLAYMTCTFSPEENEEVVAWFLARNPGWQAETLESHSQELSSMASFGPAYRLFPHRNVGVGGFTVRLRAPGEGKGWSPDRIRTALAPLVFPVDAQRPESVR
jgi:16S rRNA C967 or C1407 C5-methylase (RsmB/RsmF family)